MPSGAALPHFTVEQSGTARPKTLPGEEIAPRYEEFRRMTLIDEVPAL